MNETQALIRKNLGEHIRQCRMEKGLTQMQLAEAAGFGEEHCRQVEYGNKALSIYNLRSVAEELNVSTDFLLFGNKRESIHENIFRLIKPLSVKELEYVEKMITLLIQSWSDRDDSV